MTELHFTVEGLPAVKKRPRIRTRDRHGVPLDTPYAYTPKSTQDYEGKVGLEAVVAMRRDRIAPFQGNVELELWIYLERNDRDGDNVAKAIADGLEGVAFENDGRILDWRIHKRPLEQLVELPGFPSVVVTLPRVFVTLRDSGFAGSWPSSSKRSSRAGARA